MRQLPEIWKKEPAKLEFKQEGSTMRVRDVSGEDGAHAGLVGLDTTFTFSPQEFKNLQDGKRKLQLFNNCLKQVDSSRSVISYK